MAASPAVLDSLVELIAERMAKSGGEARYYKHTTPSGTPSTPYIHGPGGLFGVSGLERDVFSTHVRPTGLLSLLQARGSVTTNPLYPYITGFQATTGSNAVNVCDDGPVAGAIKNCIQTAQFGRYTYMTREAEIDRVGQRIDRGEFDDLFLVNSPVIQGSNPMTPLAGIGGGDLSLRARAELMSRMLELGVTFERTLAQQLYTGNPANNTAGNGYKEFPGIQILVGTDKVDALTGTNCPSLDSDIKNYNFQNVDGGTPDVVEVVTYMYRFLRKNAATMGFTPVDWVIAMREELFYELTSVWPCSALTYRCTLADNERLNIDARDQMEFRDQMRQGQYLLIDRVQIPVVTDDGIPETTSGQNANVPIGGFASDIYFIPLAVRAGRLVTFLEYLNYSEGAMQAVQDARLGSFYWTDGGRFLFHVKPPLNWCVQLIAKVEPRLILLTPHLAGRIQNVVYVPLQHTRQPFPADPYFVDGGVTTPRAAPSLYSDWNLP